MSRVDLREIVLQFNDCINNQDLDGLAELMTDDHVFIDRENTTVKGKSVMVDGWKEFFRLFPQYYNTFEQIEVIGDIVAVRGFAIWSKGAGPDHVLWTAKITGGKVAEWRIHHDTAENRKAWNLDD